MKIPPEHITTPPGVVLHILYTPQAAATSNNWLLSSSEKSAAICICQYHNIQGIDRLIKVQKVTGGTHTAFFKAKKKEKGERKEKSESNSAYSHPK